MMNNYDTDDFFLAKWIAGDLSKDELMAFKKTKVYKQYVIINNEAQLLEAPTIDTKAAFTKIKQQLYTKQKSKVRTLWYTASIAAMFILGIGFFLTSSKTYTTAIGETQSVTLADGSIINLNANSSISHKRFFWDNNKNISLKGEAYFTISKGGGFSVQTSKGLVSVLGTQFNIKDRNSFDLKCFEGKVSFKTNTKKEYVLEKGMQVGITHKKIKETIFTNTDPDWKTGVSVFTNQPLIDVLSELTNYYPINFDSNTINSNRLFTGSFTHDNLNTALQATLVPMGIQYQQSNNSNTFILTE